MKPRLAALLLLAVAATVAALAVGQGTTLPRLAFRLAGRPAPAPIPRQEPGPWFTVDRAAEALLAGLPSCLVGCPLDGGRPNLRQRRDLHLPDDNLFGRVPITFVVETVIAPSGAIGRARVLRGPDTAAVRRAVAEALQGWRFAPPRARGEKVALFYTITLQSPPSPPAGRRGQAGFQWPSTRVAQSKIGRSTKSRCCGVIM